MLLQIMCEVLKQMAEAIIERPHGNKDQQVIKQRSGQFDLVILNRYISRYHCLLRQQ